MTVDARNAAPLTSEGHTAFRQGAVGETLYWAFAAAAGCLYLGAAACLVWMIRDWLPASLQPSLSIHLSLFADGSPHNDLAALNEAEILAIKGGIFDLISRIIRRCGRNQIFVVQNVGALRWIGCLAIAEAVDLLHVGQDFVEGFIRGWRDGPRGIGAAPHAASALYSGVNHLWDGLALIALPFVLAWVFRRGVTMQCELDEVV